MSRVYVSIGSNIDRERYITACLDALADHFGELMLSPVYESEPVGFEGGTNFYNMVAGFDCDLSVGELSTLLRRIEADNGRTRTGSKFSSRTLDIDILTYDDATGVIDGVTLPREEILHNAFVLQPLADIAGDERHPVAGRSYGELWADYDRASQKLWPVDFSWRGRQFSRAGSAE